MDIKFILAIASSVLAIIVFIPYFRDIFRKRTQPHMYSWLMWSTLQVIGAVAALKAGSGYGSWSLGAGALFCFLVFLLSFKYGTKNITRFDVLCLIGSLVSLAAYFIFDDPLWTVIFVVITDFLSFLPTMRKSYQEPETETMSTFLLSAVANILSLFATEVYSFTTVLYLVSLFLTNSALCLILVFRRRATRNSVSIEVASL